MATITFTGPCPACKQLVGCEQLPEQNLANGYFLRPVNVEPHDCPDPDFWQRSSGR